MNEKWTTSALETYLDFAPNYDAPGFYLTLAVGQLC
jgi:hypothetical protein